MKSNSSLISAVSDSVVLSGRSIKHITRSFDQVMSATLFPIMFLILFRYVFGGAIDTGGISYVNFLMAGILVQTLAFGANYTTLNLAVDLQRGVIDRFRSMPMADSALIVGHIVADVVRNIISSFIMVAVSLLVGFRPTATISEWILVFILAILFSLAISWISAIMGLFVKSLEAAQWVGFIVIFPLTFASSAFVPTTNMPYYLRLFAENQPVTQVINAIRSLLVGTPAGDSILLAFIWTIAIILVCAPLTTYIFRMRGRK